MERLRPKTERTQTERTRSDAAARDTAETRANVERVARLVREGRYRPDSFDVAEAMILTWLGSKDAG